MSREQGSYEAWNSVWTEQSQSNLLNPHYAAGSPETIYQFWQKGYAIDLLALTKNKNYRAFCELGSGRGTTTMYLSKAGYDNLTMVDLAEQAFDVAKYSFKHHNLNEPSLILADVQNTGLDTASFDCIYNIGLLEHFDDPRPTLEESFRLLKKNGLIFMPIVPTQPAYKSVLHRLVFNPLSLAKRVAKQVLSKRRTPNDINRTDYRRDFYIDLCTDIGFSNVRCIPYNPYWKVNPSGWFETNVTLAFYKWLYRQFRKGKTLSLACSSLFDLCFLLTAEK